MSAPDDDDEPRDTDADSHDEDDHEVEAKPVEPKPTPRAGLFDSPWTYLLAIPLIVVVWMVLADSRKNAARVDIEPTADTVAEHPLTDADQDALAAALAKAWAGEAVDRATLPERLTEPGQAVYLAFRADGKRLYHLWRTPADLASGKGIMWDVVLQALEDGRRGLGDRAPRVDRLELDLTHSYRTHDYADEDQRKLLLDQDRHKVPHHMGIRGLEVTHGDKTKRYSPTWFVSQNRKVPKQLKLIRNDWSLTDADFATSTFRTFEADQVLVRLDRSPAEAVVMTRGNRLVDVSEVNQASTDALATGMANWLINNVDEDGRLVYHYFPSPEKEAKGNNMIRQWMATNALVRWAHDREDQAVFDLVEKNIDYNLEHFFHYERDRVVERFAEGELIGDDVLGVIEYNRKTKLGGVALAGMAMWLHPKRDKWADEIAGLQRMVDYLWHDDGSFTSFYKGSDKEYFNFYPGEAMLWWATIYAETKDPELLRKYKLSFEYYRKWHLEEANRNPAFVPWHLQADYAMWKALGPEEQAFKDDLVEFCFEIAHWLVDNMQQWDEGEYVYEDERGRFYAPAERWGVPHASSTGVYLEGLIDAWQLARDLGDAERQEHYRVSMIRGIRSMMQLQFVDDVDMFYVSDRKYVEGGIRTTVYDNRIRCDNVQHPMMGIIKIVRMFGADEYGGAL
ncbi:hypothetical protein ENSA5_02210 [Enhygromyxa salina]|uniref:Uncharacterized protein n=1 Tax=Enhygromyxa salina TaxID=215803 RepID=A0A2S9YK85_9BACT|nr:hypothetical protein [Enhygromyxa salina]PRQ05493.1 hypothetical protein ENSA5_02210 [Enhygromyxa salina]